jgi:hypothetical protein
LSATATHKDCPFTLQDLRFPPSDDEDMLNFNALEGININDLDMDSDDEDLLND